MKILIHTLSMSLLSLSLTGLALAANNTDQANDATDLATVDIVGEAFSIEEQVLLYREYHTIDGNAHQVIYRDPQGQEFSRKTIDYSQSDEAPSFEQRNQWSGEIIAVSYNNQEITLSYRNERENDEASETLTTDNSLIIDAGFNRYIQNNWQTLLKGESATFDYALADRQDLIALEIEKTNCEVPDNGRICFSIGADNTLIRWIMGSLELVYDESNKQLLRFTGLANINDRDGKGLKVDIRYHYPKPDAVTASVTNSATP